MPLVSFAAVTAVTVVAIAYIAVKSVVRSGDALVLAPSWIAVRPILGLFLVYAAHAFGIRVSGLVNGFQRALDAIMTVIP